MPNRPPTVWVHRLSSNSGGTPLGSFDPGDDDLRGVLREILKPQDSLKADPAGEQTFLNDELLKHGRLRQGWGVPGLSLIQDEKSFCKQYAIAARRYWNAIPDELIGKLRANDQWNPDEIHEQLEPFLQEASGRRKILERMAKMNRRDIILVPNVPDAGKSFTVCQIADFKYTFEERTQPATYKWERDFGHLRLVEKVKTYQFGRSTLAAGVFGAPFRHAIDKMTGATRLEGVMKFLTSEGYV